MKRWLFRIVALAILAAVGWWAWGMLFPDPEQVIRKRLGELAEAAAVPAHEAPLAGVVNSSKLAGFFNSAVRITVDVPGQSRVTFTDRDECSRLSSGRARCSRG